MPATLHGKSVDDAFAHELIEHVASVVGAHTNVWLEKTRPPFDVHCSPRLVQGLHDIQPPFFDHACVGISAVVQVEARLIIAVSQDETHAVEPACLICIKDRGQVSPSLSDATRRGKSAIVPHFEHPSPNNFTLLLKACLPDSTAYVPRGPAP